MNTTTKKRGRPALTPGMVEAIASAPKGQPVIVKTAKSYSLAYHHACKLRDKGIDVAVVPPAGERVVGSGLVTNHGETFALAAVATGKRRTRLHKQVVVV
jgi:hypothetical protein